jgi:cytochrome c-type biogenesis protein CcmE
MTKGTLKKRQLFLSLVIVVAVVSGLSIFQATRATSSEVLTPKELSEIVAKDPTISMERIRVGGRVTNEPISYKVEPEIMLSFSIEGREEAHSRPVRVVYKNLKPDMFESGRDVLIDGDFKNQVLEASTLLTQCPSKYEPPSPQGSTEKAMPVKEMPFRK